MINVDWVKKEYQLSDVTGKTVIPYGVLILSRIPIHKLTMVSLPTQMYRSALIAEFIINNEIIQVGTVHLESLDSRLYREDQLHIISKHLTASTNLLMGDFNFDSERNWDPKETPLENDNIKKFYPKHVDLWFVLNPNDPHAKTFDTEVNTMISGTTSERMRYDRQIMNSETWKPKSIEMLGTKAFMKNDSGKDVFPSGLET